MWDNGLRNPADALAAHGLKRTEEVTMPSPSIAPRAVGRLLAAALGAAALGYAAYAAGEWYRYGRPERGSGAADPNDPLDRFMPEYEVGERHEIEVDAPATATYAAARAMDIMRHPLIRTIFAVRELPARLRGSATPREPRSLVDETQALGWRILSEEPGRALVMGEYTRTWEGEVTFHGLAPEMFAGFGEPGWVKIAWTLEALPLGTARSRFVTRTRAYATDAESRERFRRYWAMASPGIRLIRRSSLGLVKREAERSPPPSSPSGRTARRSPR